MNNPTAEQFGTYQSMYEYFNKQLFKSELPNCLLNFSRKNKKSAGHFSPDRWQGKDASTHEININPLHLANDSDIEVAQTLVHEMCHLWQQEFGKPSRANYHNKEWANKMQEVGLMPSSTGRAGGKTTGQSMSDYPIENGVFEKVFNEMPKHLLFPFKSAEKQKKKKPAAAKKNKIKYTCQECSTNVWGKEELKILCMNCVGDEMPTQEEMQTYLMQPAN